MVGESGTPATGCAAQSDLPGSGRHLTLVLLISLLGYLPFLNEALHIDSDMLVHTARQILVDPVDPPLGEYGELMALHDRTRMPPSSVYFRTGHPPLLACYLVPAVALAGEREWVLHLAMLPWYVLAVLGGWYLFGLVLRPSQRMIGTLMWATCPALVVNSHTLMWDVAITALMVWSLALFLSGLRGGRTRPILLSGVVAGIAALTKTNSIALYPVVGGYCLLTRRWRYLLLWMLPAVAMPMVWVVHNLVVFERIQYLSVGWLNLSTGNIRYRAERFLSCLGGTILPAPFWFWVAVKSRQGLRSLVAIGSLLGVWSILLVLVLDKSTLFAGFFWLCATAGAWLLWRCSLLPFVGGGVGEPRGRQLVAAYTIAYCAVLLLLPSANARYALPIMPVGIALFLWQTDRLSEAARRWTRWLAFGTGAAFSLLLSAGDFLFCEADRCVPALLQGRGYVPSRTWYYGRLSFAYYLHKAGFRHLRRDPAAPQDGDWLVEVILPDDYRASAMVAGTGAVVEPVDTLSLFYFPVRTIGLGAGFYGTTRLPYSVGFGSPQKRYVVYRVHRPVGDVGPTAAPIL